MPLKYHFTCPLRNGIHARPASSLEEVSRDFVSEIVLTNQRTQQNANTKSVLAIVSADIHYNDSCELTVTGPDEQEAFAALSAFVGGALPHCDDTLPANPKRNGQFHLPLILERGGMAVYCGNPVVPGIVKGRIVRFNNFRIPASIPLNGVTNPNVERHALDEGLQKLIQFYNQRATAAKRTIEIELFKAHRAIVRDSEFQKKLHETIANHQKTAAGAILEVENYFSRKLSATGSALLNERALDIQDVCFQLLRQIYGEKVDSEQVQLVGDSIVVAETLTPGQFLALNRTFLKGLALAHAGTTSHTVILARSFGIPTLTGVSDLLNAKFNGEEAVIDTDTGALLTNLTDQAQRYYAMEQQRLLERQKRVSQFSLHHAVTRDGRRIEIGANIANLEGAANVFAAGAEGIGLFRTEMLFLSSKLPPNEQEQFETYRQVLEIAQGLPVIIRTLDIGGDKQVEYLNLPIEENPFLGYRALRIYPGFESLFRTQIRALIRASVHGKLKLLVPMVAAVEEARWVKNIISEEQAKCAREEVPFDPAMLIGAMIEVPSTAFAIDELCREFDFFSIGSNDLLQYFVAADRTNDRVANLYNPFHPAFFRLLKQIVDNIHANNKWVGLCGEIGGQSKLLPVFVGLGLDEISMTATAIAGIKLEISELTHANCHKLFQEALKCATADEVVDLLDRFAEQGTAPLIDPALVIVDSSAATKEEVIKQAVDRMYVLGRTENSRAVEDAITQREQQYSTGFGYGFAIPHCKTNAVKSPSLVVVKLRSTVTWNSLDDQPVKMAILLAIRETDSAREHLKILAKLARLVMNEDFRASLEAKKTPETIEALLKEQLSVF